MDSLTQITLGAAVGEAVAGKKIGNRAMLWGAVAGTIPDLDVIIGNLFMDDLSALAFHRGFMHSFTFAFLFSFVMTALVYFIYNTNYYQKNPHRISVMAGGILMMLFMAGILNLIPMVIDGRIRIWVVLLSLSMVGIFTFRLWKNYYKKEQLDTVKLSLKHWYLFFLLTIVTHPLLDSFTTYGTQLFQPFSDFRVSWDNISVFDPFYTTPFLIFLLAASFVKKGKKKRAILNYLGLIVSSIYMIWTFSNKQKVNRVFEDTLTNEGLFYNEYITTPTIANNLLWNCVAKGDSFFYTGFYSVLDKEPVVKDLLYVPVNAHLIRDYEEDETIKTLKWFSNGYNSFVDKGEGNIQANDLRYGRFNPESDDNDNFIFKFDLSLNEEDAFEMNESRGGPPENQEGWFKILFDRIKGI